jgi:hypothetical protein
VIVFYHIGDRKYLIRQIWKLVEVRKLQREKDAYGDVVKRQRRRLPFVRLSSSYDLGYEQAVKVISGGLPVSLLLALETHIHEATTSCHRSIPNVLNNEGSYHH